MNISGLISKNKGKIAIVFVVIAGTDRIISKGSGFIYQKPGVLVTCNHVVNFPNTEIFIKFQNDTPIMKARVILRDEEHDLVLLKFDNYEEKPLETTEDVKEGDSIFFSGYPLSLGTLTTHQGIISSIVTDATGVKTYLIDGTVNAGNSGCPLMNTMGKVIGVVNASQREQKAILQKVTDMQTGAVALHGIDLVEIYQALIKNLQLGIGYAIPVNYIPTHQGEEILKPKEDKQSSKMKST